MVDHQKKTGRVKIWRKSDIAATPDLYSSHMTKGKINLSIALQDLIPIPVAFPWLVMICLLSEIKEGKHQEIPSLLKDDAKHRLPAPASMFGNHPFFKGGVYEPYDSIADQHGGHLGHYLSVSQRDAGGYNLGRLGRCDSPGNLQRLCPPHLCPAYSPFHDSHPGALPPGDQCPPSLDGVGPGRRLSGEWFLGSLFRFPPHQFYQLGPVAPVCQLAAGFQCRGGTFVQNVFDNFLTVGTPAHR